MGSPHDFLVQALLSAGMFLVMWAILGNFVFKPFLRLLEEREHKTTGALENAQKNRELSRALEKELADRRREANLRGLAARDAIVKKAQEEAKKVIDAASKRSDQEREHARNDAAELRKRLLADLEREAESVSRLLSAEVMKPPSQMVH